ncbi:glycosyltransferase [Candidatus Microgenomates bacterium]|nr:glycosyltransferase [Candidatus Microgenomates bacterium]
MALALAHDWFNTKAGGGEQVALALAELFPTAPMFTLIYNQAKFGNRLAAQRRHVSWLNRLPRFLLNRPRYLLPLVPAAVKSLDFSDYNVILSSSVAFMKNLRRPQGSTHICYCHSPMRFAWDYAGPYMAEQRIDPLRQLGARLLRRYVKAWDRRGSKTVDVWLAKSRLVAERIQRFYGQAATVVYPPVDTAIFKPGPDVTKQAYYVTMAMLTPYKKLDIAIKAFNQNGQRLVVIGDGPDRSRLTKLAGPNIEFAGYVDGQHKIKLLQGARGLIYPNEEDFGIAPVEAMAAGTPVIAYGRGGVTESVLDGRTGILFSQQTVASLQAALVKAEATQWRASELWQQAQRFDRQIFAARIKEIVNSHVQTN